MALLEFIPIGMAIAGLGLRFYTHRFPVPEVQAPRTTAVLPARKRHTQRVASRVSQNHAVA